MILRPSDDCELMALVAAVLVDDRLSGDTRALLAGLLIDRGRSYFPMLADLGNAARMQIGPERGRRVLNELRAAGYLARVFWTVPFVGTTPAYTGLAGEPRAVACVVAHHRETNAHTGLTARPKAGRG